MKQIKHPLVAVLLLAGALSLQTLAWAADGAPPADPKPRKTERREQVRDRLKQLAQELNLSEEQKTSIKPILREQTQKLKALREDKGLSPEERIDKAKEIREAVTTKLKDVLTAEQFEMWQSIREDQKVKARRWLRK